MRRGLRSVVCVWTAWMVAFGGCRPPQPTSVKTRVVPTVSQLPLASPSGRQTVAIVDEPRGALTLAIGSTGASATNAQVTSLTQAETDALLARLEPLPVLDNSA